jgi:glycerophosphoryl diester phosphodiesterase
MPSWPYPYWIAHRGAGKLAPENTLAAFRLGAAYGYRAYECDVKVSADGVCFLLHDDTLDRTTDGQGDAGHLPWVRLSQRDAGGWHSRAYAGEPLATLAGIARFVQANGHALNIEIKPSPGRARDTGEAVAREAERLWAGQTVPPLLSSFQVEALEGARSAAPQVPRALLLDALPAGWLDTALRLQCVAVVVHHPLVSADVVQQAHHASLRLLVYTANEPDTVRRLAELGVDGIITDAIDRHAPAAPYLSQPRLRK